MRFVDDFITVAESEGDIIQQTINEMDEIVRSSKMEINSTKSLILVCAKDS